MSESPDRPDVPSERDSTSAKTATLNSLLKPVRQLIVFVIGTSVVLIGIAMIVLPGPATIVIPAGLAILATEFVWARHCLNYVKRRAKEVAEWSTKSNGPSKPDAKESVKA